MTIDFESLPHAELVEIQKVLAREITRRTFTTPIGWKCEECRKVFGPGSNSPECVDHLMEVHGYPYEDASISSIPIYA